MDADCPQWSAYSINANTLEPYEAFEDPTKWESSSAHFIDTFWKWAGIELQPGQEPDPCTFPKDVITPYKEQKSGKSYSCWDMGDRTRLQLTNFAASGFI